MSKVLTSFLLLLIIVILQTSCKSIDKEIKVTQKNDGRMLLQAKYSHVENGDIKFALLAERLNVVNDEYLPSSEDFRVIIFNSNSDLIYNSDHEQNFLMVIKKVEPSGIGSKKEFEMIWNKKSNFNKTVTPGKYKANLMIPALPYSYSITLDFEIN
jgi:hypothetical protein